ncbi:nucleolar protein 8 isoform X2 [Stigmatopora argus]
MPRLYVGGLSHLITQKELKDRFGKFGQVEDVEVRTRRDDEGVPYKTFAYINLNTSDADLKKCMTVLNKSKWKGGTLQIEHAKESFLNKLARERETEQLRLRQPKDDKKQNVDVLLEAFSKAGVNNFTMKAAVPGTEVPGHENWVVSKFGRVLPVMELRCKKGGKTRTVKYNPSKYSHNIRRLEPPVSANAPAATDAPTPVAELTWQIEGGDDMISKKRRGEFAPFKSPRAHKTCAEALESLNIARFSHSETRPPTNGFGVASDKRPVGNARRYDDGDSDEEMRRLVALERLSHPAAGKEMEEDILEVVGDDYLLKAKDLQQNFYGRSKQKRDEEDYDSADTDELLASRKPSLPPLMNISAKKGKRKREEEDGSANGISVFSEEWEEEDYHSDDTDQLCASRARALENISGDKEKDSTRSTNKKKVSTPGKHSVSGPDGISADGRGAKRKKVKGEDQRTTKSLFSMDDSSNLKEISIHKTSCPPQPKISREKEKDKKTKKSIFNRKEKEEADDDVEEDEVDGCSPAKNVATARKASQKISQRRTEESAPELKGEAATSSDGDDDSGDSDYEAMFSNVTHLEISLSDLQTLVGESRSTSGEAPPRRAPEKGILPEEILASLLRDDKPESETTKKKKGKNSLPPFRGTAAAALYGEGELDLPGVGSSSSGVEEERQKKDNARGVMQIAEIVHLGSSSSGEEEEAEMMSPSNLSARDEIDGQEEDHTTRRVFSREAVMKREAPVKKELSHVRSSSSGEEEDEEESSSGEEEDEEESSSGEDEEESSSGEEEEAQAMCRPKLSAPEEKDGQKEQTTRRVSSQEAVMERVEAPVKKALNLVGSSSSGEEEEAQLIRRPKLSAREEEQRQKEDNTRRLAAVQRRQKEAQRHKELVQGALSNVDSATARTGKHVVFDSDDDDDEGESSLPRNDPSADAHVRATTNESLSTKMERHGVKTSGPKLFGGSDDDEEEEGGAGFHVRPQFEGKAGQKLMALQSRFGTDERFRMDSRFQEEEEEEENDQHSDDGANEDEEALQEEKRRNMSILQGLLGPAAKTSSAKVKTFRDVSALHYDPGREDHAAFETKVESRKESKSARRKKREEAQKLPEVSKEIFYDVSGDLKAMFGSVAERRPGGAVQTAWDQNREEEEEEQEEKKEEVEEEEKEEEEMEQEEEAEEKEEEEEEQEEEEEKQQEEKVQAQAKDASPFMFSFFGNEVQTESPPEEYKTESVGGGGGGGQLARWQRDPRLQDSSEEEDEQEGRDHRHDGANESQRDDQSVPALIDLFFFQAGDSRLTEGPREFCRSTLLEDEWDEWEETRTALKQEYRKRHRDARRMLKSAQKT